jgi:hypothetical protein
LKSYVVVLLLVVGILGGFYGGYKIGQNNVSASTNNPAASRTGTGTGFGGGGGRAFGAACPSPGAPSPSPGSQAVARGTITNLATGSMTLTNTQCDVKVVFGNTVQVYRTVAGNTSDLKDNISVTISGTRQADGSIKATTIQIGGGGGALGNPGGAQASPGGG